MSMIQKQNFGVEIKMTGITRAKAAQVMAEHFGTRSFYIGTYYDAYGQRTDDMAEIRIADTGRGLSDEEKQKVFDKFYCGKNKIADNRRSLGLGLYLCKAIVEAHGGALRVEDNQPQGSVFSFTLPLEEVVYHE